MRLSVPRWGHDACDPGALCWATGVCPSVLPVLLRAAYHRKPCSSSSLAPWPVFPGWLCCVRHRGALCGPLRWCHTVGPPEYWQTQTKVFAVTLCPGWQPVTGGVCRAPPCRKGKGCADPQCALGHPGPQPPSALRTPLRVSRSKHSCSPLL